MDIAWLIWGVTGGAVVVGVTYLVLEALKMRREPAQRPLTDAEIMSRVDELSEAVEKLLKVYRSTQMKRVRAAASESPQEEQPIVAQVGDRKAVLRQQLFKMRGL
jgi:hypothetical protein